MKTIYFFIIQLLLFNTVNSQVFDVEKIQYKGDASKFINIVIVGDGFVATEQAKFTAKAKELSDYLFTQAPWANYKDYFNVYAIKVISNQSGIKHPNNLTECTSLGIPTSNPDCYFGSSFDSFGIHRLVVPSNTTAIDNVLATNFPNYDQVIVLANSDYYGGSGGFYCTATIDPDSSEVLTHELGHSFGRLGDEYYAGDVFFAEKPNMTKESNVGLIKWKNWLTTSPIGVYNYCCGGASNLWFRPTTSNCKMELLGKPFCSVCSEAIIERVHTLTNPIVSYSPSNASTVNESNQFINFNLTELMRPIPNTLNIKWQLNATIYNTNSETFQVDQNNLLSGNNTLTATVVDNSNLEKITNHDTVHFSTVTWTITRSNLGVDLFASTNEIGLKLYPNPSSDVLNIELGLTQSSNVSIELIAMDGKKITTLPASQFSQGKTLNSINIANLSTGNYSVVLKINGAVYTKNFIKQ
jgi:IgA Peptidase M64/Secretion system C-terminal sorting domain